ncbi:MAG: hypothetical protein GF417_08780 [Candidatus Latescibacteria bacterium]|nr:hypothetical protein [Candidatus Latescibacterota bacterium]
MKFRNIFGVSFFRWVINGIVFVVFCLATLILGMTAYSFYDHYFEHTNTNFIGHTARISDLEQVDPRLYSFINHNSDKIIFLLFIDFNCHSCAKFWERIEEKFDAVGKKAIPVIITSNLSEDIPMRYLLYDKTSTVINFFGLVSDPSGIIIRNMKIVKYLNSPEEIMDWFSSFPVNIH